MKTTATVLVMMLIISTVSAGESRERGYFAEVAKYTEVNTTQIARGYLASLKSDNDGVKESALAHVAMMKLAAPAIESNALRVRVREIARNSASTEIRYKAHLVTNVIEHPAIFSGLEREEYTTADELFAAIARRLGEFYTVR